MHFFFPHNLSWPGLEPRWSNSEPSALTTGLLNKAVGLACLWYSWPCISKVAPCTVVQSYIKIFLAWWVTTILYNYGATLCELCYKIIMIGQYLITTSSCNKVVFIANCNIRYLSLMSSQSGKKSTIFTGPDFNQAVISTLRDNSNMNKFLLSPAASFVRTKW